MKTIAIILAGGIGSRFQSESPKQFALIEGEPIFVRSIAVFEQHPLVDEIIVVVNPQYKQEFQKILKDYSFVKIKHLVQGGKERSDSSLNALKKIDSEAKVLLHDAVRPFVSPQIITDVILALDTEKAVNVGVAATDTLLELEGNYIKRVPVRENLRHGQTPQGFWASVIKTAYCRALEDEAFAATDDCSVVHRYMPEVPVYVVKGEPTNKKITFPSDLD